MEVILGKEKEIRGRGFRGSESHKEEEEEEEEDAAFCF